MGPHGTHELELDTAVLLALETYVGIFILFVRVDTAIRRVGRRAIGPGNNMCA